MKQVYAYAVSKCASDNDLLKITQAQIVINCIQEEPPACGIQRFLGKDADK